MNHLSCPTNYSFVWPYQLKYMAHLQVWYIGDGHDGYSISIDSVYYSEIVLHLSITSHTYNGACAIKTMGRHDQNFHEYWIMFKGVMDAVCALFVCERLHTGVFAYNLVSEWACVFISFGVRVKMIVWVAVQCMCVYAVHTFVFLGVSLCMCVFVSGETEREREMQHSSVYWWQHGVWMWLQSEPCHPSTGLLMVSIRPSWQSRQMNLYPSARQASRTLEG